MLHTPSTLRRALLAWLPLATATTLLCGLVYAAVEYEQRSGGDDPQIQLAEDAAARLNSGATPATIVAGGPVDLAQSVAPYMIIFDDDGRPLVSTAVLDGKTPLPPLGVLDSVRRSGEDRITWQPAPGVRQAIVVTRFQHGFVLAGRSLRLVEQRESGAEGVVAVFWFATLGATALVSLGAARLQEGVEAPPGVSGE